MNCSRCQAELPVSATICSGCGSIIQQGRPVAFSYLPAGTPSWPTTLPLKLPCVSETTTTAMLPAMVSASKAEAKPKRSASSILVAAAVLILVPLLGSGVMLGTLYLNGKLTSRPAIRVIKPTENINVIPGPGTSSQQESLPAPASFSEASNRDLNIALKYPSDWQASPDKSTSSTSLNIQQQQYGILFLISRFSNNMSANFTSAEELNREAILSVTQALSATNLQNVTPATKQPTIGGAQWAEQDVTFMIGGATTLYMISLTVQRDTVYYNIIVLTPDGIHIEAMSKYIKPMLNSIHFLS